MWTIKHSPSFVPDPSCLNRLLDHHLTTTHANAHEANSEKASRAFNISFLICAQPTKNGLKSLFYVVCLGTPTRKAAGSNPVGRTKQKALKSLLLCAFPGFLFFAFRFVNPVKNVDSRAFSLRRERTTGPCLPGACYDMIFP